MTKIMINYFLSGWIANFGVDPLFAFFAFLFVPAFFFLMALFVLEIRVHETIDKLLVMIVNIVKNLVPLVLQDVKVLLILQAILFPISLKAASQELPSEQIILTKGSIQELNLGPLKSFSVGNKDVLSVSLQKSNLLLKGKTIGHSDLVFWDQQGKSTTLQIFVLSKTNHLNMVRIIEGLKAHGIMAQIMGPGIRIVEELKTFNQYKFLVSLLQNEKQTPYLECRLAPELERTILGKVYQLFFEEHVDMIRCQFEGAKLLCHHPKSLTPSTNLLEFLRKNYYVQTVAIDDQKLIQNYQLKIKLILTERFDGEEINLGIQELTGDLAELFTKGLKPIVLRNALILGSHHTDVVTLTDQEFILIPNEEASFSVGAEIPFESKTRNDDGVTTSQTWKFAGLKTKITLKTLGNKKIIYYENDFSRLTEESSLSGNKEKSALEIELGRPTKLFQIY